MIKPLKDKIRSVSPCTAPLKPHCRRGRRRRLRRPPRLGCLWRGWGAVVGAVVWVVVSGSRVRRLHTALPRRVPGRVPARVSGRGARGGERVVIVYRGRRGVGAVAVAIPTRPRPRPWTRRGRVASGLHWRVGAPRAASGAGPGCTATVTRGVRVCVCVGVRAGVDRGQRQVVIQPGPEARTGWHPGILS